MEEQMKKMRRRDFLAKGTAATVVGGAGLIYGCTSEKQGGAPAVQTRKKFHWRMVTTWQPHFPVIGEGADLFAKWVEEMSDGRLKIDVYGGNELVPALQAFDAVSQGTAEMSHGASYYWAGKVPAAQFFSAVPFGMNAQQMNAWLYSGGGLELWEEVYASFNVVPIPGGNTGVQMGGWFNKEINSTADLQGLKMRIPGLGGKVIAKAGGSAILSAGAEIYTNLERGVIDATEWIGPYHDFLMGFHKIAKYYYYPGWHEPGTVLEVVVNKSAYDKLPHDLQQILRTAAYRSNIWMLSEFEAKNRTYLHKLQQEKNIQIKRFPDDVLNAFRRYSKEVIAELIEKDPLSQKVYQAYAAFREQVLDWSKISEKVYYDLIGTS
ncbi:MAG: TRAP transporter substrate-binding protein [Calditrichaeota bacterium]|nr:MAG: TRAP transporter substrate-binding protein [Calditrichota bacterium]